MPVRVRIVLFARSPACAPARVPRMRTRLRSWVTRSAFSRLLLCIRTETLFEYVAHFDTLEKPTQFFTLADLDMGACAGVYRLICWLARLRAHSRPAHAALQLGNMSCILPRTLRVRTETLFLNMHVRNSTVTTSDVHPI